MINHESLVGRLVRDSDGDIQPVIFIDKSVGITLDSGKEIHICINGPLSPHRQTKNYENTFNLLVRMIDNWYIDLEVLTQVMSSGRYGYSVNGNYSKCAVSGI